MSERDRQLIRDERRERNVEKRRKMGKLSLIQIDREVEGQRDRGSERMREGGNERMKE